jgi:hypothetical protein
MNKSLRALADHVRCCPSATPREQAAARAALSQGRGPVKREIATVAFAERRRAQDEEREAARKAAEYDAVERRAGARCEVTGAALSVTNSLVIHHIVYGQGVDRDKVTVADLMIRVLGSVHRQIHRSPLLWEREMKEWAASHGYTRAWNEIDRRCESARARGSAARAERERSGQ